MLSVVEISTSSDPDPNGWTHKNIESSYWISTQKCQPASRINYCDKNTTNSTSYAFQLLLHVLLT